MGPTPTGDEGRVSGATPPPANRVGELREDQAAAQVITTRFDDTPDRPAPPRMRATCRWPGHRMPVRPGGAHARISAIRDAIATASAVVNGANSGLPSMRWNPASILAPPAATARAIRLALAPGNSAAMPVAIARISISR